MQRLGRGAITTAAFALAISGLGDQPAPGAACSGYAKPTDAEIDAVTGDEQTETQTILQLLQEMTARWNQHDIDGFMTFFWHSDDLVAVIDSEVFRGWNALYRSYEKGYSDRNAMGFISVTRVEVKLLQPDLAAVITWWALEYTPHRTEVMGTSTVNLRKFSEGWRIIFIHSVL
jgi:uncharacterized protein (TIGR02246 family)